MGKSIKQTMYSVTIMSKNAYCRDHDVSYRNCSPDQVNVMRDLVERLNKMAASVRGDDHVKYLIICRPTAEKYSGLRSPS